MELALPSGPRASPTNAVWRTGITPKNARTDPLASLSVQEAVDLSADLSALVDVISLTGVDARVKIEYTGAISGALFWLGRVVKHITHSIAFNNAGRAYEAEDGTLWLYDLDKAKARGFTLLESVKPVFINGEADFTPIDKITKVYRKLKNTVEQVNTA